MSDLTPTSSQAVVTDRPDPAECRRLLATYLRDHRAAGGAGLALTRRCRRSNDGTALGRTLAEIEDELIEDLRTLTGTMERLGVTEAWFKQFVTRGAELIGRLKSNGRIWRYSPSSRVLELEGLMAGIVARRGLWVSMRTVTPPQPGIDEATLDRLIERATSQIDRLAPEHQHAASVAFGAAPFR